MSSNIKGINTICTHAGVLEDTTFKGAVSPLYMSTSYDFMDVDTKRTRVISILPTKKVCLRKLQL